MKSLYYRSQKVSSAALLAMAITSVAAVSAVNAFPQRVSDSQRSLMIAASRRAEAGFDVIRRQRDELGLQALRDQDPAETGMLGPSMSMVTSLPGHLASKQTSANPNFAAVAVHYLNEAGVRPGDHIAIGCTGSFPALNVAVLSAAETMGLKVSLISSAASSQFGANHPEQMWPEMEKRLAEEGVLTTRSLAVSRGGFRDNAAGMTDETRAILDTAIHRSGLPQLQCASIDDSIAQRMKLYADSTGDAGRLAAYINVGGGSASVGGTRGNDQLGAGLILPKQLRRIDAPIDSVAARFLRSDVPVINMIHVVSLAQMHGLPVAPRTRPLVGDGDVYASTRSSRTYAAIGIVAILLSTYLIMRPPLSVSRRLETISGGRLSLTSGACWML